MRRVSPGGLGEGCQVREVLTVALDETTTLPERGVPGLRAPLVGRDDEIDLLESIYTNLGLPINARTHRASQIRAGTSQTTNRAVR